MRHEPQSQGPPAPEPDSDGLWQGLPLELSTPDSQEETPDSSQATVVQLARPLPAAAAPASGRLLGALLLWTGTVALALAAAALVLALLHGTRPVGWRGPLLAFDAAVILLVVRSIVARGADPGRVVRRFLGGAGLAAAAAVILGTLLHSADQFIHGGSPATLLLELSVFGLLGLAGCMVFVECLRDQGWACRAAVVATTAFVPLVALGTGHRFELFTVRDASAVGLLKGHLAALAACGLCGAGLVASLAALKAGAPRSRLRGPLAALWLAMLLAAAAFMAFVTASTLGVDAACLRLWVAAAAWCVPPLAVLALAGMASCWGRRGDPGEDASRATGFAWRVLPAGGMVVLGLGLYAHGQAGGLEPLLLAGGVVAALVIAWLATTRGAWTSRWALLPVGGLAVGAACGLSALLELGRDMGVGRADVWNLGAAYLWCVVVVGLALALAGTLVGRQRGRAEHPARALQDDLGLLTTTGCVLGGACLAVVLALWLGRPEVSAALHTALSDAGSALRDLVALGGGRAVWDRASRLARAALPTGAARMAPALIAAGGAAVLLLHVLARSGVRWSLWGAAALWCAALAAASAFCVLYATGLFLPLPVAGLTTPAGHFLESHFAARLALLVVAAGLVARFWQALGSNVRAARAPQRSALPAWPHRPGRESAHLRHLVVSGVALSAVGLAVALLMNLHPRAEGVIFEWTALARSWTAAAVALGLRVGRAARAEPRCAAALAVIAYALLMTHEEARNGRPAVYPLAAAVWLGLLAPWGARLIGEVRRTPRPPMPGRIAALVAAGLLLAALAAAAVALLVRWWRLRRDGNLDEPDQSPRAAVSRAAAHGLGTLGLVLTLAACLIVSHGALAGEATYERLAGRLDGAAAGLVRFGASQLATAELFLTERGNLALAALALGVASALLLLLHVAARHRVFLARSALYSVWFTSGLAGLVGLGFLAYRHPPGTWSAGRLLGWLALAAFIFRAGIALASPGAWLVHRPKP